MSSPPIANEVEAKLTAPDAATLRSIAALKRIGRFELRAAGTSQLETTYLDTKDGALSAGQVALRVRSKPSGWEMTAKWRGSKSGDVHTRPEINAELGTPPAPPYPLPPGPIADKIAPILGERTLEPLVVTAIERTISYAIDDSGTTVAEIALDSVRHSAPGSPRACAPYFEVEVELIDGPESVVAEISDLLRSALPLQPARGTKFSRAMKDIYGRER